MKNLHLRARLLELRAGTIDFAQFIAATGSYWENAARKALRTWKCPEWQGYEDALQEVLLEVWKKVWLWEPDRGASIEQFVTISALRGAQYNVIKNRCSIKLGEGDRVGFVPVPLSSLDVPEEAFGYQEATQEELYADQERLDQAHDVAITYCNTDRERIVIDAIRAVDATSLTEPALRLFNDDANRSALGLDSPKKAARVVIDAARRVRDRMVDGRNQMQSA